MKQKFSDSTDHLFEMKHKSKKSNIAVEAGAFAFEIQNQHFSKDMK